MSILEHAAQLVFAPQAGTDEVRHTKDTGSPWEQSRVDIIGSTVYFILLQYSHCSGISLVAPSTIHTSRGWRGAICHSFQPGRLVLTCWQVDEAGQDSDGATLSWTSYWRYWGCSLCTGLCCEGCCCYLAAGTTSDDLKHS